MAANPYQLVNVILMVLTVRRASNQLKASLSGFGEIIELQHTHTHNMP